MIFDLSDYKTRASLETAIAANVGIETNLKAKSVQKIIGTAEQLKNFQLSTDTSIYGVTVEINEEK